MARFDCNHCGRKYSYYGSHKTLCRTCEEVGHKAPFQGKCPLCNRGANKPNTPVKQAPGAKV